MADVNLTLTVPDALVPRVTAAFKSTYNYQDQIPDPNWVYDDQVPEVTSAPMIANPETVKQFIEKIIKTDFVRNIVVNHEAREARNNQIQTTRTDLDAM